MISLNWPKIAFLVMVLSWFAFILTFSLRKQPPSAPEKKRDRSSIAGIALQGTAYAAVWIVRRPWFTPMFASSRFLQMASALLTMLLAIGSVWFCSWSIRTLGQQWSVTARVVEGHKLVTEGPYSIVRNPIYSGMLGMLLATGLAVSHWIGLVVALIFFGLGTAIRVRSEAGLLREMFGDEFHNYERQVPAVIPFLI